MPFIEAREQSESAAAVDILERGRHVQGSKLKAAMNGKAIIADEQQTEPATSHEEMVSDGATPGAIQTESRAFDAMEDETSTPRPPSPTLSGAVTPPKRVAEGPARLRSLVPPPNFGATKSSAVYRSAFPQDRNIEFLETLNVKTVLCLVGTAPSESYNKWIKQGGIKRLRVGIAPNKDGQVSATRDSLCEASLHVLDAANFPLLIHCNQGRHRTGCVIACLRKVQRWPIEDILAEYRSYADPKARPGDIELIETFDPNCLFDYAQCTGLFDKDDRHCRRMDSGITDVDMLAEALSSLGRSDDLGVDISGISGMSNASTVSDDVDVEVPLDPMLGEHSSRAAVHANARAHLDDGVAGLSEIDGLTHAAPQAESETTTTVVELSVDAMTPPAIVVPNPLARLGCRN